MNEQNYPIFWFSADPFLGPDLPNKFWPEVPRQRARECVSTVTVQCNLPGPLGSFNIDYLWCKILSFIIFPGEKTLPCEENMGKKESKKFLIPAPQIWTGPSLWQEPNKRIFFPRENTWQSFEKWYSSPPWTSSHTLCISIIPEFVCNCFCLFLSLLSQMCVHSCIWLILVLYFVSFAVHLFLSWSSQSS